MLKNIKRLNTAKHAYNIQLDFKVLKLGTAKKGSVLVPGKRLNVAFIKKGAVKSFTCASTIIDSSVQGGLCIVMNERMNLTATIYKDSSGKISEKRLEFIIRESNDNIGHFEIKLHECNCHLASTKTIPVTFRDHSTSNAVIEVTVTFVSAASLSVCDDESVVGDSESMNGDILTPSSSSMSLFSPGTKGRVVARAQSTRSMGEMMQQEAAGHGGNENILMLRMKLEQAQVELDNLTAIQKDKDSRITIVEAELKLTGERLAESQNTGSSLMQENASLHQQILENEVAFESQLDELQAKLKQRDASLKLLKESGGTQLQDVSNALSVEKERYANMSSAKDAEIAALQKKLEAMEADRASWNQRTSALQQEEVQKQESVRREMEEQVRAMVHAKVVEWGQLYAVPTNDEITASGVIPETALSSQNDDESTTGLFPLTNSMLRELGTIQEQLSRQHKMLMHLWNGNHNKPATAVAEPSISNESESLAAAKLADAQSTIEELTKENENLRATIASLEASIESNTSALQARENEMIADLQQQLATVQSRCKSLEAEVVNQFSNLSTITAERSSERSRLEGVIQSLTSDLEKARAIHNAPCFDSQAHPPSNGERQSASGAAAGAASSALEAQVQQLLEEKKTDMLIISQLRAELDVTTQRLEEIGMNGAGADADEGGAAGGGGLVHFILERQNGLSHVVHNKSDECDDSGGNNSVSSFENGCSGGWKSSYDSHDGEHECESVSPLVPHRSVNFDIDFADAGPFTSLEDELRLARKAANGYHTLLDEERARCNALKNVLLKFSGQFSQADNDVLMESGVILVPHL